MDKLAQLNEVFRILLESGKVRNKKGFAELLDVNYPGLISAFSGNEKYLTDSLVAKANALLAEVPEVTECCSLNPSPEYAPFELEVQYIRGWYRVLMIMSLV